MNFYIIVKKRIAEVLSDGGRQPLFVCGNADNRIIFTFDDEWPAAAVKTARFVYRENGGHGSLVYRDVPLSGNSVTVPTLYNVSELWVGVISQNGIATSAARIACVPSIGGLSDEMGETEGEEVEVELMLTGGDQIVSSTSGAPMSRVTIKKPEALIPENIRAGVTIAGVVGTCSPDSTVLRAPTLSFDGDILNVSYDGEKTRHIILYADGDSFSGAIEAGESGVMTISLLTFMTGFPAGTYVITAVAYSNSVSSDHSNSVICTIDGTEGDDVAGTYIVALGGDGIELSYKIGTDDMTGHIESWDESGADGTVTTPTSLTELKVENHILLYLPDGVVVSGTSKCSYKVHSNPRFVELYDFIDDGFAICNFEVEALGIPTLHLDGTTLIIEQTEGIATSYDVFWSTDPVNNFTNKTNVTAKRYATTVDISPYLKPGNNYFTVWAYDGETSVGPATSVGYMVPLEIAAPTVALDGPTLVITQEEGTAERYQVYRAGDTLEQVLKETVEASEGETRVDLTPYLGLEDNYIVARAETAGVLSDESNEVTYTLKELTAPTISIDGSLLTVTPGEGITTHYFILSAEYGVSFSDAAVIDANGSEPVTVDVREYVTANPTHFKVASRNCYTGEYEVSEEEVSCEQLFSLTISDYNNASRRYCYAVNMSLEDFLSGKFDAYITKSGSIEGLRETDTVYIRLYPSTGVLNVHDEFGCSYEYGNESQNFIIVTDFYDNATMKIEVQI
ncbi:MAG: hypothetical protein IKC26_09545 [Clostridia bacterium]|nr:hypothetical protein [Clostridia bacterium]